MAHQYLDVSNPTAYKFGAGYMSRGNFGVEASYMNLGTAYVSGTTSVVKMSGTNMSVVFDLPIRPLTMSFKLGLYNIDTSYKGSATSSGLSWGFLIGYQTSENFTLFMDTEGFNSIVVPNGGSLSWETPALITFGARVNF